MASRHRRAGRRVFRGVAAVRRRIGTGLGREPLPTAAQALAGHVGHPDRRAGGGGRGSVLRHMRRGGDIVPPPELRRTSRGPWPRHLRPRMRRWRRRWRWRWRWRWCRGRRPRRYIENHERWTTEGH